jgi:drug/metabolite transporter (DMT)-like permease
MKAGGGADAGALALLAVGVVSVAAAAVFVRLAAAHPLTASFVRLAVGAVVLLVIARARQHRVDWRGRLPTRPSRDSPRRQNRKAGFPSEVRFPQGADLRRSVLAGALLAAHFALWIGSLSSTTVAASVVIVCLQPVFAVAIGRVFLREHTPALVVVGIATALAGAVTIAFAGAESGASRMTGNALALGGAITIALYVLVQQQQRSDIVATSAVVTTVAALCVLPLALAFGAPLTPQDGRQAFWLLLLALGPQVIGQTALSAALRRLPASVVSGSILGEPVVATALAAVVLDEHVGLQTLLGGAVTLCGVVLIVRAQQTKTAAPSSH